MKRNGDILQTLWQHRKFSILFLFSTFLAVSPYFWQTLEMWALILFFSLKKKIKSVEKNYLVSLHINTFQNIWKLKKQHTFFLFFWTLPSASRGTPDPDGEVSWAPDTVSQVQSSPLHWSCRSVGNNCSINAFLTDTVRLLVCNFYAILCATLVKSYYQCGNLEQDTFVLKYSETNYKFWRD